MAQILLSPKTGAASIDGEFASDVNYTGINPTVTQVFWDTVAQQGFVSYEIDPFAFHIPAPTPITSFAPYQAYADEAAAIIHAKNNPITYYSTSSNNVHQGDTYGLGQPIIVDTPATPPPPNTTLLVPPTLLPYQQLWWYNNSSWVASPFNPDYSLSEAQNFLTVAVETSASEQGVLQARIYSPVQLSQAPDILVLPTADYYGLNLGDYQTYLDGQVSDQLAILNAATTTTQLYEFDPTVDGNPNP